MTRITKATLAAQLEAAHVSYEKLAAECAALRAENQALREHVAEARRVKHEALVAERDQLRTEIAAELRKVARPVSDFRARCQAARELAMRSGRCVRVS